MRRNLLSQYQPLRMWLKKSYKLSGYPVAAETSTNQAKLTLFPALVRNRLRVKMAL
ncbi:hypothetical protein [Candidatus Thiodiazotropha endoloripes]|uniref:hypothetical protein n=1 Tax=Candidatus Thiodiazotropha endoloripes TaxID=1818881 RepID=UPI0012D71E82|nr:hypothetical protein [Candidatus Thiodiazotropha endoloripes]